MLTYKFDPILNKEQLFQLTPPACINFSNLPKLANDQLVQFLASQCQKLDKNVSKQVLYKHISDTAYPSASLLIEQLQLIYYRLHGNLDPSLGILSVSDRTAIISKLIENISQCTEGFHNRVNDIVNSLERPRCLSELLYQVRSNLVKNLATTLTAEVHTWNTVSKVAVASGLGIKANYANDPHSGGLPNINIFHALKKEFEEKYVPFNLPFLLAGQLRSLLLVEIAYTGPKKNGYTVGIAEKISLRIKDFLSKEITHATAWQDFFIIDETTDFDIVIRDLNWKLIRKFFFITLSQENYFSCVPLVENINSLLDCARFSKLFSDNNLLGIEGEYITEHFEKAGYAQLNQIKAHFPVYWKKLKSYPKLIKQIPIVINQLEKTKSYNDFANQFNLVLLILEFSSVNEYHIPDLLIKLIKINRYGWNALMVAATHYHASAAKSILEFITQHRDQFDQKTLAQMFLERTVYDENALLIATRYQSVAAKSILEFIDQHNEQFTQKTLTQMFLTTNWEGWNALMLAVRYRPDLTKSILEFIAQHSEQFTPKTLRQMFLTTTEDGSNVLMLAARYQPDSAKSILEFIAQRSEQFAQKTLTQMFLATTWEGWNALTLVVRYQTDIAKSILEFTDKLLKLSLENYLADLANRKEQNITHTTRFFKFNFGYSTQEKITTAQKLKTTLEKSNAINSLLSLKKAYPALNNGRLGHLFQIYCQLASNEALVSDELTNTPTARQENNPQVMQRRVSI
jgi:hypothetical protein